MANHPSAEKRARQSQKRAQRNNAVKSKIHTAEREVRSLAATSGGDPKKTEEALRKAFRVIQKARGSIHRNAVKRKMARLSKAVAKSAAVRS